MFTVLRVIVVLLPLVAALKIGDREIFFHRDEVTWDKASENCKSNGLQLVTIRSDKENEDLYNVLESEPDDFDRYAWLGAKYINGDWRWGEDGDKVQSTYWMPEEPKTWDNSPVCAIIYSFESSRRAYPCGYSLPYFCEALTEAELNRLTEEEPIATTLEPTTAKEQIKTAEKESTTTTYVRSPTTTTKEEPAATEEANQSELRSISSGMWFWSNTLIVRGASQPPPGKLTLTYKFEKA